VARRVITTRWPKKSKLNFLFEGGGSAKGNHPLEREKKQL